MKANTGVFLGAIGGAGITTLLTICVYLILLMRASALNKSDLKRKSLFHLVTPRSQALMEGSQGSRLWRNVASFLLLACLALFCIQARSTCVMVWGRVLRVSTGQT